MKPPKLRTRSHFNKLYSGSVELFVDIIRRDGLIIGQFTARGAPSEPYMTVASAQLYYRKYQGKGYGHQFYKRLAQRAQQLGFKGIRSHSRNRNEHSNGAWKKIRTKHQNGWDYLTPTKIRAPNK